MLRPRHAPALSSYTKKAAWPDELASHTRRDTQHIGLVWSGQIAPPGRTVPGQSRMKLEPLRGDLRRGPVYLDVPITDPGLFAPPSWQAAAPYPPAHPPPPNPWSCCRCLQGRPPFWPARPCQRELISFRPAELPPWAALSFMGCRWDKDGKDGKDGKVWVIDGY